MIGGAYWIGGVVDETKVDLGLGGRMLGRNHEELLCKAVEGRQHSIKSREVGMQEQVVWAAHHQRGGSLDQP